jgi:hypothetical protein
LSNNSWSMNNLPDELRALYLSYSELSHQLKQCFLYCAIYPATTRAPRPLSHNLAKKLIFFFSFLLPSSASHQSTSISDQIPVHFPFLASNPDYQIITILLQNQKKKSR